MNKILTFLLVCFASAAVQSQDSLNMKRLATVTNLGLELNDIWGYRLGSQEFAIVGSNDKVNILDVTDCSNPTLMFQWDDGSDVIWRDFKDYGDYLYGVCDGNACQEGLQIISKIDYSFSQNTSDFTRAHNIHIDTKTGKLYVLGSFSGAYHGMLIYDLIANPADPPLIKTLNFRNVMNDSNNYYVHDAYIHNDTAYCNHGNPGMKIWDLRDLDNVNLIGETLPTVGYNHSSWKHPNSPHVIVAEETHGSKLRVEDVSDFNNILTVALFKDPLLEDDGLTNNIAHNPFIYLNRLYVSYYHDGIQIYDFEDPVNPERIAYYDTYPQNANYNSFHGAWGTYPFLPSGCILVSDIENGFMTLKTTLIPESSSKFTQGDLYLEGMGNGVIFQAPDDKLIKVTLNVAGDIQTEELTSISTEPMELVNSNLEFSEPSTGIIMSNPSGKYFRLSIDDDGDLETNFLAEIPQNVLKVQNQDLYLSQYRAGIIFKNDIGTCYHYTYGENGTIELTAIDCD